MNDRDVLKRASEALRDASEPSAAELAALRARVLSNKVTPLAPRARAKTLRWLLPLAAALVTGSALAATPGAWQGLLDTVERYLPVELLSTAREASRPARKRVHPPPLPKSSAPVPVAEAPAANPTPPPSGVAASPAASAPRPRAGRSAPPPVDEASSEAPAPAAVPAPAPEPSEDLLLYKRAHELHFRARNYVAALAAWDAYLARFPGGTLALEAEYNRALSLIRLGRYPEARAALAPFAEGRRGGYRRREAAHFLEVMEKVP
jgi:hypothetical protein